MPSSFHLCLLLPSVPMRRIRLGCWARSEWPSGGRTADECDEHAPFCIETHPLP